MCNQPNCQHDLDDDLSDLTGDIAAADAFARAVLDPSKVTSARTFETPCPSCRGSGRFRSYTGRIVGDCFKCKGSGVIRTKTDPKVLAENREKAAEKRAAQAAIVADNARQWLLDNPDEARWLADAATRGFEFAQSMREALFKYGHLTERQEAAVRNATAKSQARKAEWQAQAAAREANAAVVEIGRIEEAFAAAKASRLRFPKLRLDTFVFSLAGDNSRNAGSIYVKDENDVYLGKITDGKLIRSRDCSDEAEARIVAACADPAAAATAYGQRTGQCSCCGRELTNEESIARAIGPICLSKWGWA